MLLSFMEYFYLLLPVLEAPALQGPLNLVQGFRFSGLSWNSTPDIYLCRGWFTSSLPLFQGTSPWGGTIRGDDLPGTPTFYFGPCFDPLRPSNLAEACLASFSSVNVPKAKASFSGLLSSPHPSSILCHQHIRSLSSVSVCVASLSSTGKVVNYQ